MKKITGLYIAFLVTALVVTSCKKEDISPLESQKYETFKEEMRVLWSDHALWTRNVIINLVDGTPGTAEAVNRLLKNQEDIGNAIKPYYGDAASDALTVLLKEHITTAADLVNAAVSGNTPAFDEAHAAWYANGDAIATFLHTANPENWPLNHMKLMMKDHLDLTLEEASARISGDYAADVVAYDKVYAELMLMSDMLAEGIALQFPGEF